MADSVSRLGDAIDELIALRRFSMAELDDTRRALQQVAGCLDPLEARRIARREIQLLDRRWGRDADSEED